MVQSLASFLEGPPPARTTSVRTTRSVSVTTSAQELPSPETGDDDMDELLEKLSAAAQDVHTHLQSSVKDGKAPERYLQSVEIALRRVGHQIQRIPQLAVERPTEPRENREMRRHRADTMRLFCGMSTVPKFRDVARQILLQVRVVNMWQAAVEDAAEKKLSKFKPGPRKTIVESLCYNVLQWDEIDVFKLEETSVKSLVYIFNGISTQMRLADILSCSIESVSKYMEALGDAYINTNSYHNRMHAAEVTVATHYLWNGVRENVPNYASQVDVWLAVLAGAMHDVGHPGVSADFLVKTSDKLALRYNDRSVLENLHAATGFEIMRDMQLNPLACCANTSSVAQRKRVIDMVLMTDMSRHKEVLENVTKELEMHAASSVDKLKVEQLIVHTADLSHPMRPTAHHLEWSKRVTAEFFAQGDREKELGFSPMSLLDRDKAPSLAKGQVGFLNFLVLPTWNLLTQVASTLSEKPPGLCLDANVKHWKALVAQEEEKEKAEQK